MTAKVATLWDIIGKLMDEKIDLHTVENMMQAQECEIMCKINERNEQQNNEQQNE